MSNERYTLRRVSTRPAHPLQITFNVEGRTRSFAPADAADEPGSPQDVPLSTARAALGDPSLAPHFSCEPTPPAETPATPTAVSAAADSKDDAAKGASDKSKGERPGK